MPIFALAFVAIVAMVLISERGGKLNLSFEGLELDVDKPSSSNEDA